MGKRETIDGDIDYEFNGIRTEPQDVISEDSIKDVLSYTSDVFQGKDESVRPEDTEKVFGDQLNSNIAESARDHTFNAVMRDARRLTELPGDMAAIKNLYENRLLHSLLEPEARTEGYGDQMSIVEEYMDARLRNCMLNPEFASKVKHHENGQYYMKLLRERVLEELSLENEPQFTDLLFQSKFN